MLPSSHLRLTALQREVYRNRIESQIPELESGENSRRKLQNVVTDSTAGSAVTQPDRLLPRNIQHRLLLVSTI
jgi:hypothetical protein